MYAYSYEDAEDSKKVLKIEIDEPGKPRNTVMMCLDPEEPDHAAMIESFNDEAELEKYVEYLSSDPDRPFRISEIESL